MKKCDFCKYSTLDEDGVIQCPYIRCRLTPHEYEELLKYIGKLIARGSQR